MEVPLERDDWLTKIVTMSIPVAVQLRIDTLGPGRRLRRVVWWVVLAIALTRDIPAMPLGLQYPR